jgi:hypothetical protein
MENYYTSSTLLFPLAALSLVSCNSQKKEEVRQPNIIFMMTDDHTTQAMSCYGGNLIQTPNMDRIANEGIHYEKDYNRNALHCAGSSLCRMRKERRYIKSGN